jgi:hypothetical protein
VAEKNRRSTEEAGKGDGRANLRERIRNATREASLRKRRRPSAKSSLDPSLTSGGVRKWLCGPQDRKQSRWLGEVEAPDEAAAIEKGARRIQGAAQQADGDTAATRRKGEIDRGDLIATRS